MALNKDQQAVFMEVIKFINGPDQFMNVSGGAGTGKTYLISQIADGILKYQHNKTMHTVAITATTNKAAAVISDAMPHRAGEIGTIYSFMNLRVSENFNTGNVKIVPTPNWFVHAGTFIIVDECSMVNQDLFKYIMKGISSSCKVLFVGDKNQLAPVKENISPIYNQGMHTAYLNTSVRNAGQQALMDLCEEAKQTVLTGKFTPIKEVPGVVDFVDGTTLRGILEREFLTEDPSKRIISYTNKRVIEYNSFIRELRSYTEPYEVGEILSNNSSAELVGKTRLYTDQVVRVLRITDDFMDTDIVKGEPIRMINLDVADVSTGVTYPVTVFADHNDRSLVLKFYSGNKKWDRFFKIKNAYPDLRSVSASTTHKAQGSTYDSVIVDLADIGKSTNKEQTARLQYVALSRPRNRLYIRGKLPERYFE
ncbi:MAG: AAA family ATPase [Actinobacteria bacterium]|nr:AAA family ATPase [Actinomycetota bacterium]MCA1806373.1 AAA family ATPase [Actinomycetota bacterium]